MKTIRPGERTGERKGGKEGREERLTLFLRPEWHRNLGSGVGCSLREQPGKGRAFVVGCTLHGGGAGRWLVWLNLGSRWFREGVV